MPIISCTKFGINQIILTLFSRVWAKKLPPPPPPIAEKNLKCRRHRVNEKSNETEGVYAIKLFDTLVTSSSEYGIKIWGFKGLEKLEKTNLHFYKYILGVTHSTADGIVYGEIGKVLCQFRFRWKQVKFWNTLIGFHNVHLHIKFCRLLSILDNNS